MKQEFIGSAEAFRKARERASVAAALQADTLHTAIYDAREAGLSVRETAAALSIPKSTVARHWREGHRCPDVVPAWGSAEEWREARAVVWSHNPHESADDHVPWEWSHHSDGTREIRRVPRGVAQLRD